MPAGNVTDEGVYLAACSALAREQERLSLPPNGQLQVVTPHSSMCVTAPDCSVTTQPCKLHAGARWSFRPAEERSAATAVVEPRGRQAGAEASNFSSGGTAQRCAFSQHSTAFRCRRRRHR